MFLNPSSVIDDNIISGILHESQIQPNAIDFSLDDLFLINESPFYLSNDKSRRVMRSISKMPLIPSNSLSPDFLNRNPLLLNDPKLGWLLQPNASYEASSNVYVNIPDNVSAFMVVKSTLNRNAIPLVSGLYDSGFKGHVGFTIHNYNAPSFIEQGALVGQIVFVNADNSSRYSGSYNTDQGEHWSDLTPFENLKKSPVVTD